MNWIVGAYAASPCHSVWDPKLETTFWDGLARIPGVAGLEMPFYGDLHRFDPEWLLRHLRPEWDYVLTCIPGTMDGLKISPKFGLASQDEEGRGEAVEFAERARQAVQRINLHLGQQLGRQAVRAVEIHSAPQLGKEGVASSQAAFTRSLQELRNRDWQGACLLIEHCDRWIPGQAPAKGFLPLENELAAIRDSDSSLTRAAVLINWGRSAIEGRSAETPLEHLRLARQAGLLGGLMFSGCTPSDPLYGAWADSHAPFGGEEAGCLATSLMTRERVREALRAAGPALGVLGFKIQALPLDLSVEERIERIRRWVAFLERLR